jgi:hypothetical protein
MGIARTEIKPGISMSEIFIFIQAKEVTNISDN